jgi:hypothetical protein
MEKVERSEVTLHPESQQLSIAFHGGGKHSTIRLGYDDAWPLCLAVMQQLVRATYAQVQKQPSLHADEVAKLPRLAPAEVSMSRVGDRFLFVSMLSPTSPFQLRWTGTLQKDC